MTIEKLIKGEPDWHEKINKNFNELNNKESNDEEINKKIKKLEEDISNKENILPTDRKRKITYGTGKPSGGSNGDIYFQYE